MSTMIFITRRCSPIKVNERAEGRKRRKKDGKGRFRKRILLFFNKQQHEMNHLILLKQKNTLTCITSAISWVVLNRIIHRKWNKARHAMCFCVLKANMTLRKILKMRDPLANMCHVPCG